MALMFVQLMYVSYMYMQLSIIITLFFSPLIYTCMHACTCTYNEHTQSHDISSDSMVNAIPPPPPPPPPVHVQCDYCHSACWVCSTSRYTELYLNFEKYYMLYQPMIILTTVVTDL